MNVLRRGTTRLLLQILEAPRQGCRRLHPGAELVRRSAGRNSCQELGCDMRFYCDALPQSFQTSRGGLDAILSHKLSSGGKNVAPINWTVPGEGGLQFGRLG